MKTIQAICALLDIDAAHPKAETIALKRLEQLDIRGDKCPRCLGEGATHRGKQTGIQCFPCRGHGYVGFSLSRSALKQLKSLHKDGRLDDFHALWASQAEIREKLKLFDQTIEQSGVQKSYSAFWAERESAGSWNRDLQIIHHQIQLTRKDLINCLAIEDLINQSPRSRKRLIAFFDEKYRIASQALDSLLCEVDMYQAWHSKPDFKSLCVAITRSRSGTPQLA